MTCVVLKATAATTTTTTTTKQKRFLKQTNTTKRKVNKKKSPDAVPWHPKRSKAWTVYPSSDSTGKRRRQYSMEPPNPGREDFNSHRKWMTWML
jgi:uncharacterized membrane protein